jgi:hypothetical protein
LQPPITRAHDRFDLQPARLAADTGYGSAEMLDWLVNEEGIEPHVPVFDKSQRTDGTFSRDEFTYDHERDIYVCPGGKNLTTKGTLVNDGATLFYRASKADCTCLVPQCDGVSLSSSERDALWAKFFTGAPRPRTPSDGRGRADGAEAAANLRPLGH